MQATINFADRAHVGVVASLDAPITKPHCRRCGMPFNLRHNDDGTWTCVRCKREELAAQAKEWRALAYRAAQMGNAAQYGRCERELEKLYRAMDALK